MGFRDRQNFMQGINQYVPAMQWASTVNMNGGSVFSLGRPLALVDTSIIATTPTNGANGTVTYIPCRGYA